MTTVSFPYQEKYTLDFGNIPRPVAQVDLFNESDKTWKNVTMVVDTGADITLLPSYIAVWLDIDITTLKKMSTQGIAGKHEVFLKPDLKVKLGPWQRTIPVGFIRDRYLPPLLGRHQFLETVITTLDTQKKVTFKLPL